MQKKCEKQPSRRNRAGRRVLFGATTLMGLVAQALAQQATPTPEARESVTVTGYRASVESSTRDKRNATGFQDSVFAEDMGKFPDSNIAESLNRIPGVLISREITGEGLNIQIRGLGTSFTKVLLNGAPVAVASTGRTDNQNTNREVDLDLLPTELFTKLSVYKSPTADMLEGGAAGVVDMRTARPFDNPGRNVVLSLQGDVRTVTVITPGTRPAIVARSSRARPGAAPSACSAASPGPRTRSAPRASRRSAGPIRTCPPRRALRPRATTRAAATGPFRAPFPSTRATGLSRARS